MDRGKNPQTRGKGKTQHYPADLFVLGAKSSGSESGKRPLATGSGERKRDASGSQALPGLAAKKAKAFVGSPTPLGRQVGTSPNTAAENDSWESLALDVDPYEIVHSVLDSYQSGQLEKAAAVICGAIKALKNSKWKPDSVVSVALIYLAKLKPSLFSSESVTQALSVLLKRDPQHNFKSKGNPTVAVLAANLLLRGYQDQKHWPSNFVKLYMEDAMSERVWVDQVECSGFINNLVTAFSTKLPTSNINFLVPDVGPIGIVRGESPLTITVEDDDDSAAGCSSSADIATVPRYVKAADAIEQIILETLVNRRQTPESVTRNYLKLLSSTMGLLEVRYLAAPRLEMWLQNPKLMKPAQEVLLSVSLNCTTHTARDIQVIAYLAKIRLKTKALINFYLACIRELINAHPENLFTILQHTIYNELSTSRNPNNMSMVSVMFQAYPEQAATLLAEVFLELLLNRDDHHRPLRALLREIVRILRHDINLISLCRGLMADKREVQAFRDFEFKERMLYAVIDLISLSCFLGVSPAVKESVNLVARGDKRELQTLVNYHTTVSRIQQEAVLWLRDHATKIYKPNQPDFVHALHKILFMDQLEAYYKVDMWPPESERSLLLRLASESPLYQNTLIGVLFIGLSKDLPMTAPDAFELADQLVKRSASLVVEGLQMLRADKVEIFEMIFNVTAYHHPDNITLPAGYTAPRLAICNLYWKGWIILLLLSVHNPSTLGNVAWEKYPTLRMFMEMCITNHFSYPPPTMTVTDAAEETKSQELRITAVEKETILEFETHLAAASTKVTITEQTSLLLPQLITMDPSGPARKPPPPVLDQLAALNATHRMGHLLCRSRHPDFLLDLIQRQGASQNMPWLADLVESSEGSLSHLPVQCLCEFLLTSGPQDRQSKSQQLIGHLQHVLTDPNQDPTAPCEVLEYLLRRLSSSHMTSRTQAVKGLKVVLSCVAIDEAMDAEEQLTDSSWLLRQLPLLPHFQAVRHQVVLALRQACQVENDPLCVSSYITFLALHTSSDSLTALALLVQDMAQLIVERSTIMAAIMPRSGSNDTVDAVRSNTLHSLLLIFCTYLQKSRDANKDSFGCSENQDQILVKWRSGEESTLHILVIHAMIILLSYGPSSDPGLFGLLLDSWFPADGDPPKAYIVETEEEALLIPDWLKLRMIRSGVDRLVDAALLNLDVPHLVLFIQSFGIPVSSMSKLLERLDRTDTSLVSAAVFDKAYMAQLVQVQKKRGATGGHRFVSALQLPEQSATETHGFCETVPKSSLTLPMSTVSAVSLPTRFNLPNISVLLSVVLSVGETSFARRKALQKLHKTLLVDVKTPTELVQSASILVQHFMVIVKAGDSFSKLLHVLDEDAVTGCLLFRLVWKFLEDRPENLRLEFSSYCREILARLAVRNNDLTTLLNRIASSADPKPQTKRSGASVEQLTDLLLGRSGEKVGQLIDSLVRAEPELLGSLAEPQQMKQLLFGKKVKSEPGPEGCDAETCRPYLLTLLTHRASWERLQLCVDHLLDKCHLEYSATAVLDFLEAMTRNPRLWQGREKHIPKHHSPESVLRLNKHQLICAIEYIIEESDEKFRTESVQQTQSVSKADIVDSDRRPCFVDSLEARLPVLLESLENKFLPDVVRYLAVSTDGPSLSRVEVCKHLLVLLYFHVPGLIQYLFGTEQEVILKGASITGWSSSTLDKVSHTLLTAMTANTAFSKDWHKRSQDFELAARKMAIVHPALVLRQLPMLAASLQGRVHLDYVVLRVRNHINVFNQVLGLIELLSPEIFSKQNTASLQVTLDAFLTLFKLHGHMKDVVPMLSRFITFLQNYVMNDAATATKYLQANSPALAMVQRFHPNLAILRSLLSGILTPRDDNADEADAPQPSAVVPPAPEVVVTPPASIVNALARSQGEDLLPVLQELDHLSARNPVILETLTEHIMTLLLSPYVSIRSLAHTLLTRLLKYNPQSNGLTGYLRCLESTQGEVVSSALEKLPEMVVSVQEHAGLLLDKVFSLGVRSGFSTAGHISKAISLLNLQSGC